MTPQQKKILLTALRIGHQAQSVLAKHYVLVDAESELAQEYLEGRIDIQKGIKELEAMPTEEVK